MEDQIFKDNEERQDLITKLVMQLEGKEKLNNELELSLAYERQRVEDHQRMMRVIFNDQPSERKN